MPNSQSTPIHDLLHRTFNSLTAIEFVGKATHGGDLWRWQCSCGNITVVVAYKVKSGHTRSCGCQGSRTTIGKRRTTHGMSNRSLTYGTWRQLRRRCYDPNNPEYRNYGGRGIAICERWRGRQGFANFLADMGERPKGLTLDRYPDNDGNYEPGNCRWATWLKQCRNKRQNRMITFRGKTLCLTDWASSLSITHGALSYRLKHWSFEKALTTIKRRNDGSPIIDAG